MPSYLIESPHTEDECLQVLENVLAMGYLTHFKWACPAGSHKGYMIIDAGSKSEALLAVPPSVRTKATVIELTEFNPEQVKSMHGKKG